MLLLHLGLEPFMPGLALAYVSSAAGRWLLAVCHPTAFGSALGTRLTFHVKRPSPCAISAGGR